MPISEAATRIIRRQPVCGMEARTKKYGEREIDDEDHKDRGANKGKNITNAQNRAGHRAAEVRHEIERIFAAERLAHDEKGNDHARNARNGCGKGRKKGRIENCFETALEHVLKVREIERVINAPQFGDRARQNCGIE